MPHPSQVLPLPFGQNSGLEFTDEAACGEFLARLPDAPSRFGALDSRAAFRVRLKNVVLPSVSLVAGASTPKATDHLGRRLSLVIPFGRCRSVIREGGKEHHWAAPHHAFLVPAGQVIEAESTAGSFLRLDILEAALVHTAAGMESLTARKAVLLDLAAARTVAMQVRSANWTPVIRSLCTSVDAFECDAARLTQAGLDDTILRTVVMMLRPDLYFQDPLGARTPRGLDVDALVERMMANLTGRMTLTDLEAWSGRTARAIQLAFQKRFGVGPMQWLRQKRLDLIRTRLLAAPPGTTVRQVAAECGMPRMATLVPEYAARFGELPSETLRSGSSSR